MSTREPSEEELRAALEEQMRRIRVEEVILQTVVTLVNLAGRRLGLAGDGEEARAERDLDQAKLAIEAVRALLPLCPEDQVTPIRDALSQLQMVFAREAQAPEPAAAEGPPTGAAGGQPEGEPGAEKSPADEAERARARSKLWTPPGT